MYIYYKTPAIKNFKIYYVNLILFCFIVILIWQLILALSYHNEYFNTLDTLCRSHDQDESRDTPLIKIHQAVKAALAH